MICCASKSTRSRPRSRGLPPRSKKRIRYGERGRVRRLRLASVVVVNRIMKLGLMLLPWRKSYMIGAYPCAVYLPNWRRVAI